MSRQQLQESEAATVPDKAMLATVLNFLKNKNLKETEEALRKELSHQGEETVQSLGSLQVTAVGQSGTEPSKYEESYTSQAPLTFTTTTTTTAACVQLARDNVPSSTTSVPRSKPPPLCTITASSKNPLVSSLSVEEEEESDGEPDTQETMDSENALPARSPVKSLLSSLMLRPLHKNGSTVPILCSPSSEPDLSTSPKVLHDSPLSAGSAAKMALDKNPLWIPNSALSAGSPDAAKKSIFLPLSAAGLPLTGSPMGGASEKKTTPTTTLPGQNLAVHPSLMYQLMSPPCMTRPLLGPVLTVLPSTSNLMTQQPVFLANSIGATGQGLGLQSAASIIKPNSAQEPEKTPTGSPSIHKEAFQAITPEPSTGQTIPMPQEFSPVSTTSPATGPRTLASIPASELTPQHLELKAFAEDFKTRRIRLGFTQGAVGQSLAERGYNNFAQSTISRFEQMQLSPANAATIRVILEKWLLEAECPESASSSSTNLPQMASRKRKKRAVFTPQTKSTLDDFFTQNPRPNRQAIENISQKLDLLPEEVRVWFCNKRQKSKSGCSSYHHRMSFDRDSSSTTSSGVPSPTMSEGGMSQKRRSPSPPKTPFTIEELSKSSHNSTVISSPAKPTTSPMFPMGLVASITQSTSLPVLFNTPTQGAQMFSNPLLSQSNQISQTRA